MEKPASERAILGDTKAKWSRLREHVRQSPRPAMGSIPQRLSNNARGFYLRAQGELSPRLGDSSNDKTRNTPESGAKGAFPLVTVLPRSTHDVNADSDRNELLHTTGAALPPETNEDARLARGAGTSSPRRRSGAARTNLQRGIPRSSTASAGLGLESTMSLMMHTIGDEFYPTLFLREFFWQAFYPLHLPVYLCVRGYDAAYAQRFLPTLAWFKQLCTVEVLAAMWNLFFFMFLPFLTWISFLIGLIRPSIFEHTHMSTNEIYLGWVLMMFQRSCIAIKYSFVGADEHAHFLADGDMFSTDVKQTQMQILSAWFTNVPTAVLLTEIQLAAENSAAPLTDCFEIRTKAKESERTWHRFLQPAHERLHELIGGERHTSASMWHGCLVRNAPFISGYSSNDAMRHASCDATVDVKSGTFRRSHNDPSKPMYVPVGSVLISIFDHAQSKLIHENKLVYLVRSVALLRALIPFAVRIIAAGGNMGAALPLQAALEGNEDAWWATFASVISAACVWAYYRALVFFVLSGVVHYCRWSHCLKELSDMLRLRPGFRLDHPIVPLHHPRNFRCWLFCRVVLQDIGRRYLARVTAYSGAALALVVGLAGLVFGKVYILAQSDSASDPEQLGAMRESVLVYQSLFDVIVFSTILCFMINYGARANDVFMHTKERLIKHRIHLRDKFTVGSIGTSAVSLEEKHENQKRILLSAAAAFADVGVERSRHRKSANLGSTSDTRDTMVENEGDGSIGAALQQLQARQFQHQNHVEGAPMDKESLERCDNMIGAALQTLELMNDAHPIKVLFFPAEHGLIFTIWGVVVSLIVFVAEVLYFGGGGD